MRRFKPSESRRRGKVSIEGLLFIGSLFVVAMVFYFVARQSFVSLYQIIAIQNGSPFI